MEKKIKVAFDLDGVIVNKPPLVPKKLLERLFKGAGGGVLHYRFPKSKLEQKIRRISHFYLFRPPIKKNIEFIKELSKNPKYELYAVSGRYSFLEDETKKWLEKRGLRGIFKNVFINLSDEQPHIFKEKKLKEIKAEVFVDDDCELADYLTGKINECKIYCFSRDGGSVRFNAVRRLNDLLK